MGHVLSTKEFSSFICQVFIKEFGVGNAAVNWKQTLPLTILASMPVVLYEARAGFREEMAQGPTGGNRAKQSLPQRVSCQVRHALHRYGFFTVSSFTISDT